MGTNIYASSRVELEFEECPYCHQNTATQFEVITAATGAWDIVKYSCLSCSRQYIKNIRDLVSRPILVRASSDDGDYEYTEESELWRTRLNYKVAENSKEGELKNKTCNECRYMLHKDAFEVCTHSMTDTSMFSKACKHFAPPTNGDKIRSMSDEELVAYLDCAACIYSGYDCAVTDCDCAEGKLAWLNAPAESEEDNERL